MGVILVQLIYGQSCWSDFMGVALDITGRDSLTANSPILWFLQSFCLMCVCVGGGVVDVSMGTGLHKSAF